MNFRVSLLLVVGLALVAGAFAIPWDDSRAPQTVGQSSPVADRSNPAHDSLAQALPPDPDRQLIAQARPPAPAPAPAATAPDETARPDAAATSAPGSKPAMVAQQPATENPTVMQKPDAAAAQKESAPAAAAPRAQAETPSPGNVATAPTPAATAAPSDSGTPPDAQKEPAPVVTTPIPATDKPAMAAPADKKPKPVVTAPPPATDKPATAAPADKQPTPVVTVPPPADTQPAPAPVVTAPSPTTDTPATASPAEKKPTPVVGAPTPATETPAAATAPGPAPQPVVAAPTPPEKPVIVLTPMPAKRPDTSEAALAKNRPAKYLFGAKKLPSSGRARAIGYYPKGCLAGAVELPVDGPTWQAMRLSRNRNWGHPELVRFIERFAERATEATGWPGILVGDLSQPRGGPTPFGHRSHQTGLDVDIWFKPMPEKRLSRKQREKIPAPSMVAANGKELNPETWTPETARFIRAAAEQPEVERVLVNAAIKKELCRLKGKQRWSWMAKVRPWYGHDDHIHVRLKCPSDSPHCRSQPAVPGGDGCSNRELAHWFSDRVLHPKPPKHPKPRKQTMLADLPAACKLVLSAPDKKSRLASDGR